MRRMALSVLLVLGTALPASADIVVDRPRVRPLPAATLAAVVASGVLMERVRAHVLRVLAVRESADERSHPFPSLIDEPTGPPRQEPVRRPDSRVIVGTVPLAGRDEALLERDPDEHGAVGLRRPPSELGEPNRGRHASVMRTGERLVRVGRGSPDCSARATSP